MTTATTDLRGVSVSHGTLRIDHLLVAFAHALGLYSPSAYAAFIATNGAVVDEAKANAARTMIDVPTGELMDYTDRIDNAIEDAESALQGIAPEGYYFGAHPGDGADFGWWQSEED